MRTTRRRGDAKERWRTPRPNCTPACETRGSVLRGFRGAGSVARVPWRGFRGAVPWRGSVAQFRGAVPWRGSVNVLVMLAVRFGCCQARSQLYFYHIFISGGVRTCILSPPTCFFEKNAEGLAVVFRRSAYFCSELRDHVCTLLSSNFHSVAPLGSYRA